jgi:hypothetical protein
MNLERVLRGAALVVAIGGVIDPTITADRTVPAIVAVIDTTRGATRLSLDRDRRFRVVYGASPDAAATVIVGEHLPPEASSVAGPAFVVVPDRTPGSIGIERLHSPWHAPLNSRVPVGVDIVATNARGRRLTVALETGGLVADRTERDVNADEFRMTVPLAFVPIASGPQPLRVRASIVPGSVAVADTSVDIRHRPWPVLFFDRRPSWSSTFVRRALEQDPRFVIDSRVITSTGVANVTGGAPETLERSPVLDAYDVIVLGAPDALTDQDIAGLEAFARRRGGAVVLLLDGEDAGRATMLTGAGPWRAAPAADVVKVQPQFDGAPALEASELVVPDAVPSMATVLAGFGPRDAARAAVIEIPVGAGRLVASGLVDAWRYRGVPAASAFDRFWRDVVARAADASPPPIDVRPDRALVAPGDNVTIAVNVRELVLAPADEPPASHSIAGTITGSSGSSALRFWPDGGPGRFRASIRAPKPAGVYQLSVVVGSARGEATVVVRDGATAGYEVDRELLSAFASSRGGAVVPASDPQALGQALARAIPAGRRPAAVHPLRSPAWFAAFAGLLGSEWWLRRRRNLR